MGLCKAAFKRPDIGSVICSLVDASAAGMSQSFDDGIDTIPVFFGRCQAFEHQAGRAVAWQGTCCFHVKGVHGTAGGKGPQRVGQNDVAEISGHVNGPGQHNIGPALLQ